MLKSNVLYLEEDRLLPSGAGIGKDATVVYYDCVEVCEWKTLAPK